MNFDPNKITFFAKTDARGQNTPFGIKAIDRQKHMYIIGKTGMGKSTLLENMAVQDMKNGEGLAFIDPHGATAETLLDYVPEERRKDVLYFAPFDAENPVAFNVMEDVGPDKRHLVVSGLMSVFKKIWVDAWSARMEYILQNTLLALLEYPDSTLLGVNRMLSDKNYRRRVIDNISDPAVKSFWVDEFLNYNERYMQEAGDAIKNKIGQFTANPLIRNIIGQPKSSFDIREIMDKKKILIMNLSKGLIGESNANLLGSMLTTRIYLAAMSRADLSQEQMREAPNFYFYVDEFQSFANATFADILSEARKYKLNLTIAHQYIEQMEEEVRNAVFGNVGTIISFRVGPFDAEVLETIFAPRFYAVDICNLGFAQVYLTLMIDGIGSHPFSAVTLPPIEKAKVSCKDIVIYESRNNFAKPRQLVEEEILKWHEQQHVSESSDRKKDSNNRDETKRNDNKQERYTERQSRNNRDDTSFKNNGKRMSNGGTNNYAKRESIKYESVNNESKPLKDIGSNKNLAELRQVLARISKKDTETNIRPNSDSNNDDQKNKSPRVNTNTKSSSRVPTKNNSLSELKSTLENIVNQSANKKTDEMQDQKPQSVPKESVTTNDIKKDFSIQSNEQTISKTDTSFNEGQSFSEGQADASVNKSVNSLDPKKLEKMMKTHIGDKTPLK